MASLYDSSRLKHVQDRRTLFYFFITLVYSKTIIKHSLYLFLIIQPWTLENLHITSLLYLTKNANLKIWTEDSRKGDYYCHCLLWYIPASEDTYQGTCVTVKHYGDLFVISEKVSRGCYVGQFPIYMYLNRTDGHLQRHKRTNKLMRFTKIILLSVLYLRK